MIQDAILQLKMQQYRIHLFFFLVTLRIFDIFETSVGLRLGVNEINVMVSQYGIISLITINILFLLIIMLLQLFISWSWLPTVKLVGGLTTKIVGDYITLLFIVGSLYTVLINNPLHIAG